MSENEEIYSSWQGALASQSDKVKIGQKVEEIIKNPKKTNLLCNIDAIIVVLFHFRFWLNYHKRYIAWGCKVWYMSIMYGHNLFKQI